ncbi:MAG: EAL domain-containing protein [Pseudomonadota bacterium]|jgi:diguanylate cyclase (GGDEF)-like protein/PAS domain S-box-containing protein
MMTAIGIASAVLGVALGSFAVSRRAAKVEEALFREKELAGTALHSVDDAVISTDSEGRVEYLNPAAEKLTGWSLQEAKGLPLKTVFFVVSETTREPLEHPALQWELAGPAVNAKRHSLLIRKDGQEFVIEDSAAPLRNRKGETVGAVLVFHDLTQTRRMAQQLSWQATHDALTGLVNRREFERLVGLFLESAKTQDKHHAVLYMDIDQFKLVNDTCGHLAGDELLLQAVSLLQAKTRENDVLARLGGDEFGVLLEGCRIDRALRIADKIRASIQGYRFNWQDKAFELSLSIGVVAITSDSDLAGALSHADAACYAAKDKGGNRVHLYEDGDDILAQRHGEMQWVSRINKAFEENRFHLYYQEIVSTDPEQAGAEHYEILLRMKDEAGNLVAPAAFIAAAERYNLMPAIDRWVIRTLFASRGPYWRRKWEDCCARHAEFKILCCINLSATSLNDDLFPAFLREQIAQHQIPPQVLCFEITETAAITNLNKAVHFMHELNAMGCNFALDDFGSGMSSFAYLKVLPVSYLKIDGAFVKDMAKNPVDFAMTEAISRIGRVMGIKTVAEFVKDDESLEQLRKLGVGYAQGYGIHMPEPLLEKAA